MNEAISRHGSGPVGPSPAWLVALSESLAEALPRLYGTENEARLTELIAALTGALAIGEVSLDLGGASPTAWTRPSGPRPTGTPWSSLPWSIAVTVRWCWRAIASIGAVGTSCGSR